MTAPDKARLAEIVAKIQGLKKLAENTSATQGEVEAALHAIGVLMARFRLSEDDLEIPDEMVVSADLWPPAKRIPEWRVIFANALAIPNGCHLVGYKDDRGRGLCLAGRAKDVEVVMALKAWLEPEVLRMSGLPPVGLMPKKWRDNWIAGFALGIKHQLDDAARTESPDVERSMALVLVDERRSAAMAWLIARTGIENKDVSKHKKKSPVREAMMGRGYEAGASYHLGKKLGDGK